MFNFSLLRQFSRWVQFNWIAFVNITYKTVSIYISHFKITNINLIYRLAICPAIKTPINSRSIATTAAVQFKITDQLW